MWISSSSRLPSSSATEAVRTTSLVSPRRTKGCGRPGARKLRRVRVFLFVATLGYSRRCYVAAFRHERQSSWFRGLEGAFRHFGGVIKEVLIDNPRPLVVDHDAATREVEFNDQFLAFAAYWCVPEAPWGAC